MAIQTIDDLSEPSGLPAGAHGGKMPCVFLMFLVYVNHIYRYIMIYTEHKNEYDYNTV